MRARAIVTTSGIAPLGWSTPVIASDVPLVCARESDEPRLQLLRPQQSNNKLAIQGQSADWQMPSAAAFSLEPRLQDTAETP
jgi:hypothetical protein